MTSPPAVALGRLRVLTRREISSALCKSSGISFPSKRIPSGVIKSIFSNGIEALLHSYVIFRGVFFSIREYILPLVAGHFLQSWLLSLECGEEAKRAKRQKRAKKQ